MPSSPFKSPVNAGGSAVRWDVTRPATRSRIPVRHLPCMSGVRRPGHRKPGNVVQLPRMCVPSR